jgi:8-oxo-dGTP pyrophosphatase MutT (NUDIX family)
MSKDKFQMGNTNDISHLVWEEINRKELLHTPIFNLEQVEKESSEGVKATFVTLEAPNWVTIIPWYRNKEGIPCFIMVQQFRHGSCMVTREFPAGMVDKGEKSIVAAKRELLEETGTTSAHFTKLVDTNPNPAFMNNRAYIYLAEDLEHTCEQSLDETEQLDVLSVPVSEVINEMGSNVLYDNGIMLMAMGLFLKESYKRPELLT